MNSVFISVVTYKYAASIIRITAPRFTPHLHHLPLIHKGGCSFLVERDVQVDYHDSNLGYRRRVPSRLPSVVRRAPHTTLSGWRRRGRFLLLRGGYLFGILDFRMSPSAPPCPRSCATDLPPETVLSAFAEPFPLTLILRNLEGKGSKDGGGGCRWASYAETLLTGQVLISFLHPISITSMPSDAYMQPSLSVGLSPSTLMTAKARVDGERP